ncbi:hypothetical protein OG21DRAFT_750496 [Imleria badia]|nr:hypothetical protein OG21DRAFT_750496 [Imleria badia]
MSAPSILSDRSLVTFAANGEYFVSGGTKGFRVWRAEDGQEMVTMAVEHVQCVAFSKDGKWIAAGTYWGDVFVWDAKTYKQTFTWKTDDVVRGLDFSPDATRLVALGDRTATVLNITARELAFRPLRHEDAVAARYSPKGDRIATATRNVVRVYDSNDGRLLAETPVTVTSRFNTGLLWCIDHLFVTSESTIKQIDASTGSVVSDWSVPDSNTSSCIAIPKHGAFIAHSANRTVTFWDTSTHTELGHLDHPQDIFSIALSPDGRFLAIGGEHEKITIKRLSRITEPDIDIDDAALDLWKQDQLAGAQASLTAAIAASRNPRHHALASRALVRARLRQWDEAIVDAKESITIQPSVMGYIAKSVSLVCKGKRLEAYRACDIAFEHCHSTHVSFLLLIKAVVVCMAGEYDDAISRVRDLIASLHLNSICYVVQAYMHLLFGISLKKSGDYERAIQSFESAKRSFERARAQLRRHTSQALTLVSLITGWSFDDFDVTIRLRLCGAMYAAGRTSEAGKSLLKIINDVDKEVYMCGGPIAKRVSKCGGNATSQAPRDHNIPRLLKEWAKLTLTRDSWRDTLAATNGFMASRFTIYQTICTQLEAVNKITDATDCIHEMTSELGGEINLPDEQAEWVSAFKQEISQKLEYFGDLAIHAGRHDEAIAEYSAVLSLNPASPQGLLIKRSKAYVAHGLWENGLQDANRVIALDPSSPWGYERKHAALHRAGGYEDAINTFETMLFKLSVSPDPDIRQRQHQYVNPALTKAAIRKIVQDTIRNSPRVLIHTISGRLLDKTKQALLFETLPVFKELISTTTTYIDHARIQREVSQYYRYATFSHTWEDNDEPLFEEVVHIVVHNIGGSFTRNKLQMFCQIAREAELHWAWSDTCCINKADHFVLQEALVAMFKWYAGSAVTIVFLRGVHSPSQPGGLMRSIWNTRGWTFQEYHASKVVRFYTEEWQPYLNLDIPNHKESPEIIAEMERATGVSAEVLMDLQPGSHGIREKLCLASRRETTLVEDAAYSLLGIFSVSLPIVYGEGDQALGRLLAQLLTSSGDTSILAWTGKSGSFNSCLPASITVFSELSTSHIPPTISPTEMDLITSRMRISASNFALVMRLYDRLRELLVSSFANQRMKLPCLTFKLGPVSAKRTALGYMFRAKTGALGVVEIQTTEDLSRFDSLTLVHPWIDFLLDRQPVGGIPETFSESSNHQSSRVDSPSLFGLSHIAPSVKQTRASRLMSQIGRPFRAGDGDSLLSPSPESVTDKRMHALQFITRLRQPFGALLFTPTRQNVEEYRRVASESLITVQVEELSATVLTKLIEGARMLDVL